MIYSGYNHNHVPSHVNRTANEAKSSAKRAKSDVSNLRHEVERLSMIVEAMWRILEEKHGFTEAELVQKIHEVDMEDGRLDGKKSATLAKDCHKCHRPLMRNKPYCMYCGEPVMQGAFD